MAPRKRDNIITKATVKKVPRRKSPLKVKRKKLTKSNIAWVKEKFGVEESELIVSHDGYILFKADGTPRLKQYSTGAPETLELDKKLFEGMCKIHCTQEEIAGILEISVDTLERRVKETYSEPYAEIYKRFSSMGKLSLRRAQFRTATVKENATMQIWLGKNLLGQLDQPSGGEDNDDTTTEFDIHEKLYVEPKKGSKYD